MMRQAIIDFGKQFLFEPVIERADKLQKKPAIIVSGMGGSHLAADLLQTLYSESRLVVHVDYGLPNMAEKELQQHLFIASSYSGNTEEVLDGLEHARALGMACAVVSKGGVLQKMADEYTLPFVRLPDTGIQPRMALGFGMIGIMKLIAMDEEMRELRSLAGVLKSGELEPHGEQLAHTLNGKVPVIYASTRNRHVAANWKIKCNETAKTPAFYNVFSELNHNEMTGFDVVDATRQLSDKFHFIFLADTEDDPRIQKRTRVSQVLYEERGLPVTVVELKGVSRAERVFSSLLLADWCMYHLGSAYGVETEASPMIEKFKQAIA